MAEAAAAGAEIPLRPGDDEALRLLRAHFAASGYAAEHLEDLLGVHRLSGRPADVAVHVRRLPPGEVFSTLVRLFLLGLPAARPDAEAALAPIGLDRLEAVGVVADEGDHVRAGAKLVPHGDLLIASDHDRDGPDDVNWVAGIHPPSVTLAKLTVRRPVRHTLDVGTGNGVQALLASVHSESVVATDVNPRALAYADVNARMNGVDNVEFRLGSFFEPVDGERFDLIVSNPPYVISPESLYAYRDSGLPGDEVSRRVVMAAADHLEEGGFAHVMISWAHGRDAARLQSLDAWVDGRGCDAWLLHFGSDDAISHSSEWLKPVAQRGVEEYDEALDRWLDYFERLRIDAIAYGAAILRRRGGSRNWTRHDEVRVERFGSGGHILRVFENQDYLESLRDDRGLLDARLALVDPHRVTQQFRFAGGARAVQETKLSLDEGLGFVIGIDDHTAQLLASLDGTRPLRDVLAEQARAAQVEPAEFEHAALAPARRLVELGFVVPR